MGKKAGFDLARHLWIVNECDAIYPAEREGVVGFNAITLGAALHSDWGNSGRSVRISLQITHQL